jgi:hypothetical protein
MIDIIHYFLKVNFYWFNLLYNYDYLMTKNPDINLINQGNKVEILDFELFLFDLDLNIMA